MVPILQQFVRGSFKITCALYSLDEYGLLQLNLVMFVTEIPTAAAIFPDATCPYDIFLKVENRKIPDGTQCRLISPAYVTAFKPEISLESYRSCFLQGSKNRETANKTCGLLKP